jgi:hypothetical protein
MKYKFTEAMNMNYSPLKIYLKEEEEITKSELIERCSGEVSLLLLQNIKEIEFNRIGKTVRGDLYLK